VADLPDLTPYTAVFAEADQIARAWSAVRGEELPADVRRDAVAAADRTVGAVLSHAAPDATVLVAGLSDAAVTAHLHVAIAAGPAGPANPRRGAGGGEYRRGWLTTASTRHDALVTITDLTATVI